MHTERDRLSVLLDLESGKEILMNSNKGLILLSLIGEGLALKDRNEKGFCIPVLTEKGKATIEHLRG